MNLGSIASNNAICFDWFKKPVTHRLQKVSVGLAHHLYDEKDLGPNTVKKMVGHLRAACNVALKYDNEYPTIKANPFAHSIPHRGTEGDRKIMDDNDTKTIFEAVPKWSRDERLLTTLCAALGIRRGEAWQITEEEFIAGHRCVHVGTKKPASDRMVVLTPELIEFLGDDLPAKITGVLFADNVTPKNLGKAVLRKIRKLGITDPEKVIHSFRHRASTRLHGCQDSERDAILGHDDNGKGKGGKISASQRYFKGHPVQRIAELTAQIGLGAPGSIPTAVFIAKSEEDKAA